MSGKLRRNELGQRIRKDGTLAKPPGRKPDPNRPPRVYKGRRGIRPQVWITGPDPVLHEKYHPWQMAKAQANFRNEDWDLSFKEYCDLWEGHWENRGRAPENVCMTRNDPDGAWDYKNVEIITRKEHFLRTAANRLNAHNVGKRGPDTRPRNITRKKCSECGIESTVTNIKRWHDSNCKIKKAGV